MANSEIFIATAADMTLAFSSIGPAFTFIQDSHADLNPEGAVLMARPVSRLLSLRSMALSRLASL